MASAGSKIGSRKDPAWKYGEEIEVPGEGGKKGYKYIKCNFCSKTIKGGVKRMKDHLACTHKNVVACPHVPEIVKHEMNVYLKNFENGKYASQRDFEEMIDGGDYATPPPEAVNSFPTSSRGVRGPMDRFVEKEDKGIMGDQNETPTSAKEHRNKVCMGIGRFFFENGIPFNCARSPSYFNMLRLVGNYGRGLKPPSMHEMRTWILKEEEKTTSLTVNEIKATWKKTGVSLLSDGWSDMRNRSLINFLINNQFGTVFLKTIDASDCVKDAKKLFKLLDDVIEEVGEEIVVQVVTDNASAYKAAGTLLMEKRKHLYWTPCAAHCIDLMLEKIGELPQQKNALLKAKKVSNFIHNHQWVLSLCRKIAKKDLLRPAATRFATAFLTLESMYEMKDALQIMFVSREWNNCAWAKKDDGKAVKKIVMDERIFWPSVVYSIKTTKPLVHVLRIVDGETPAMGFIYGAMDEAREKIAENFNKDASYYQEIYDIIDAKWDHQLHRDLHAAGYYLNPQHRWSPDVSDRKEIKQGLYRCIDRIIRDDATQSVVDNQIEMFKYKRGMFRYKRCLAAYMTRPPVEWWDSYGDDTPELKAFAIKVLGLTCSASECERNWSTFNQVHTKRRNRLSTKRMNSLVYIMYNKKLKHKFLNKRSPKVEDDMLIDVPSDDEWIAYPTDEEDGVAIGVDEPIEVDYDDDDEEGGDGDEEDGNGDEGQSLALRKRKGVQVDLEDEDDSDYGYDGGAILLDQAKGNYKL